ncbi:hypothetical protein LCGC14_2027410 [marine sediment metagenome]|uniref:Uncharacterized protein n=1 Tax=marine sediment metagenome TaxID=412755 RepID=A0A0F9H949_9ZZZZ
MDRLADMYDAAWKDGYTDGACDANSGQQPQDLRKRSYPYREGYTQGRTDAQVMQYDQFNSPESCGNSWGASW